MAHPPRTNHPRRSALAAALTAIAAAAAASANAQTEALVQTITITGRSANNAAGIAGFGDVPLYRSPFSATVISTSQLQDAGIAAFGDITRLDAGVTDAYNAPGYWGQVAVRGYTLDNRFNFRRDGLPINAETVIATANKQAMEVLKGASGIQAGTSAPGGLVNFVVKRPTGRVRGAELEWSQPGTLSASVDLGDRSGGDGAVGWRVNAQAAHLDPITRNSRGHAGVLAAAVDVRPARDTLLEAEVEFSRQSEPSTPGFSLLGTRLPAASSIDPRLNLNNQPWSLPVVMDGATGSLRVTQSVTADTQLVAQLMRQRLTSQDRIAFPFGCGAENNYASYCSDGTFDFYDFRSEGERRTTDAADLRAEGKTTLAGRVHRFNVGLLASRYSARLNGQAYNGVGIGNIDGSAIVPPDPTLAYANTNRSERSTELHLQDAIELSRNWQLWLGARHTRMHRESIGTDGSEPTGYAQSFTTPWLALNVAATANDMAYASWGQGIESELVPKRPSYNNPGQALPALKSRQIEIGWKHHDLALDWRVAAFDTRRPVWSDLLSSTGLNSAGGCSSADPCNRRADGAARHQGVEAEGEWRSGAWSLRGSLMWLRASREGSVDAAINGLRPTNVPAESVKLQAAYNVAAVPGLALLAFMTHEGQRMVLPDNSIATPGWTRVDLGARWAQMLGTTRVVWRAGIANLANQRAWKEAPFQYGHAYLYPLQPRTLHASANFGF